MKRANPASIRYDTGVTTENINPVQTEEVGYALLWSRYSECVKLFLHQ